MRCIGCHQDTEALGTADVLRLSVAFGCCDDCWAVAQHFDRLDQAAQQAKLREARALMAMVVLPSGALPQYRSSTLAARELDDIL